MRVSKKVAAATLISCLALPLAVGAEGERGKTSLSRLSSNGRVLTVSTGTTGGECTARGRRLACYDGESLAIADAGEGCFRAEHGGRCILDVPDPATDVPAVPGPAPTVTAESSTIDIECETGSKRGSIYTLADGDGTGSCGPNKDVDSKVNGGTCTKNGSECGSVDCDHGCGASSQNCGCHVKSSSKKVQASS